MNYVLCFHKSNIINTFLKTIHLREDSPYEGVNIFLMKDPRSKVKTNEVETPEGLNVQIIEDDFLGWLNGYYNLKEINQLYVKHQTHHIKIAAMAWLRIHFGLKSCYVFDDDVVLLERLGDVFTKENGAWYMNSPLQYYWQSSAVHMAELEEFSRIVKTDLNKLYKLNKNKKYPVAQINAGHFKIELNQRFDDSAKSFYSSKHLAGRFLKQHSTLKQ